MVTEVTLKAGELFYNAPTDDVFVGNGKDIIGELTPLNVAGLTATHSSKTQGIHSFVFNSHLGNAKVFSFISYITNDYQIGDAISLTFGGFSSQSTEDDKIITPLKILTTHRMTPEKQAFKAGDMLMFMVHINDNYELDNEGFMGQAFIYYLDNEGSLILNYNYNLPSLNPNHPITKLFPQTLPQSQKCDSGETVTVFPISLTSREYEFLGWFENDACIGTSYAPGDDIVITSNKTLYAGWKLKNYVTLSYSSNKSSSEYSFLGEVTHVPSSERFYKPEEVPKVTTDIPIAQGGTFKGQWAYNSNYYTAESLINTDESITLLATWTKHTNYTIIYMDGSKEVGREKGVGSKNSITLLTPSKKDGYNFGGWYIEASFKTKAGTGGDTYVVPPQLDPNANIRLYGKWIKINIYTVTISCTYPSKCSLTINDETKPFGSYTYQEGTKVNITVTPTASGYTFTSWTIYGGRYTSTGNSVECTVTSNMTVTANIEPPPLPDRTVTAKVEHVNEVGKIPGILLSPASTVYSGKTTSKEFYITGEGNYKPILASGIINKNLGTDTDNITIAILNPGYDTVCNIDIGDRITFASEELGEWLVKIPFGVDGMTDNIEDAEYY